MTTITIKAVYRHGVFRPLQPVSLPDDTQVEIRVPQEASDQPAGPDLGPLAGAFPGLAELTAENVAWAGNQWEAGLAEQLKLLTENRASP